MLDLKAVTAEWVVEFAKCQLCEDDGFIYPGKDDILCERHWKLYWDGWLDLVQLVTEVATDNEGRVRGKLE